LLLSFKSSYRPIKNRFFGSDFLLSLKTETKSQDV